MDTWSLRTNTTLSCMIGCVLAYKHCFPHWLFSLTALPQYVTAAEGNLWFWIKTGMFVTVVVIIGVYYMAMWLWRRELQMEEDLKRLSHERRSRLTRLFSKPKVKGY